MKYPVTDGTPTIAPAVRQVDALSGEVADLQGMLSDAIASRDAARADTHTLTAALRSVNCQCAELASEAEALQDRVGELLIRLDEMTAERDILVEQRAELVEQRDTLLARAATA